MRHAAVFALVLFLLLPISASVFAFSPELDLIDLEALEAAQPEEAQNVYGFLRPDDVPDVHALLLKLWGYLTGQSGGLFSSALQSGAEILAAAFLTALCCAVSESKLLPLIGSTVTAMACIQSISSCASVGKRALESLTDYSRVLLPCLSTAAAAGGAWSSAGAKYAASMLFIDFMTTLEQNALSPLLYLYAATAITAHLTEHPLLLSISGLMKQAMKWCLIIITMCFTFYLNITGILSGTVDAAAAKAAKTVISSALPVVGKILADASGAFLSGVQMLRNGIGIIGMLVVLAVCVVPYVSLGSHYLVFQISAGVSCSMGDKRLGGVIRCIGDVYGFLLGMVGSVSMMLLVSIVALMKAVGVE